MKKIIQLLIILLCSVFINGQSGPDFSILSDKAFQKLYQNPDDCISYSQSLLISDQNIEHRIVLQNIISQAYAMKGDYVQSVNTYSQKEDSGERENLSYFLQVFGDYNLADQYQNLDLYNQSTRIISHLLADSRLLKSDDAKLKITTAKLYQLQALNFGLNRNYPAALENLAKSDQYLGSGNQENLILGIENKIFKALYLMRSNHLEEARSLLESALLFTESKTDYAYLQAMVHESLSRYYFFKQEYTTAVTHLEKALTKVQNLPYSDLKSKIYESLSKNYFALHNDKKYHEYNKYYTEIQAILDSNTREGIRYIIKLVEANQTKNLEFQEQNESKKIKVLASIFSLLIIILIVYFLFLTNKNKEIKKQSEFFEKQKKWEEDIQIQPANPAEETVFSAEKSPEKDANKISKEKEDEILLKLAEWEKSDRYLNKSMSISMLSAQMGINTKYLSEVINNSKGKNFNGYINELRINHIAHLLKTDPVYLNYKVSYLAEYGGFSSHSAFTTVFKSVTGMSPNTYIQEISKSNTL
ncbi:AraC family transcriptional regulator [Chryseobacterium soli]|uniref:helix-turn-helix domain-containing protein n=1 Tax=Chryseobacterium soli TaxID=445961 RepID=UPI002952AF0B|nr:AraC family transcriptional regulator [Chryseobacterium soli]MDV7697180.1 AraC family transcriptional regulator [Chryseobacterium soli]